MKALHIVSLDTSNEDVASVFLDETNEDVAFYFSGFLSVAGPLTAFRPFPSVVGAFRRWSNNALVLNITMTLTVETNVQRWRRMDARMGEGDS